MATYAHAGAISYSAGGLGLLGGGGYGIGNSIAAAPIAIAHAPVAVAHQPVVDSFVSFDKSNSWKVNIFQKIHRRFPKVCDVVVDYFLRENIF